MPIAYRYADFTINVGLDDIPAIIRIPSDETAQDLLAGQAYEVPFKYNEGRPALGRSGGPPLRTTQQEQDAFIGEFTFAQAGQVEGEDILVSEGTKFPSGQFAHDIPIVSEPPAPTQEHDNSVKGTVPDQDTLFSGSTLANDHPMKNKASFRCRIFCHQGWLENVDYPNAPDL